VTRSGFKELTLGSDQSRKFIGINGTPLHRSANDSACTIVVALVYRAARPHRMGMLSESVGTLWSDSVPDELQSAVCAELFLNSNSK
jgi:hypothetical protein